MSYIYLQEQGEECSVECFSDIEQSVLSRLKNIPGESFSKDNETESFQSFQSGTMSQPLTATLGETQLTFFAEDFHAKTSVQLEKEKELQDLARDFGSNTQELLKKLDLHLSLPKILHCLEVEDLELSSKTLPPWGMMQDGVFLEVGILKHHIPGKECGYSLPTPTASDFKRSPIKSDYANRPKTLGVPDDLAKWVVRRSDLNHARLEPDLWEWAMSWPMNWTGLKQLEMDKIREWLEWHSEFFQGESKENNHE
jgi:hypothetical protein